MSSATFFVQIIAAISIPVSLVAVAYSRTAVQKPIRTRDIALAIQFACIPALVVLALSGLVPWWVATGGLVVIAGLAFVQGTNTS